MRTRTRERARTIQKLESRDEQKQAQSRRARERARTIQVLESQDGHKKDK